MTAASKLPDLVVQKIIGIATESFSDWLLFWKNALPLLAVCSAWRHAAKPIVYSKVSIVSTDMVNVVQRSTHRSHLLDRVLNSNIDLIASVSSTQLVKRVDIDIKTLGCLHALVCEGGLEHYLCANSWSGVTSLRFKLAVINHAANNADHDCLEMLFEYQETVCNAMAKHMPGIVDVSVDIQNTLQSCILFGRLIAETYFQQLRSLKCSAELLEGITKLPSQIARLSISFDLKAVNKLPKLDAAMLEHLEIKYAPESFDLISLIESEKTKSIEFANLLSLKLEYREYRGGSLRNIAPGATLVGEDTYKPKLLFPRLENLVLNVTNPRLIQWLLFSGQYCWKNASSLVLLSDPFLMFHKFNITSSSEPRSLEYGGNSRGIDELSFQSKLCGYLLQSMPRVSKLSFLARPCSPPRFRIQNWSEGCFVELVSIKMYSRTTLDYARFSENLVSLNVAVMDESWPQFPYLNTRVLQNLRLKNVRYNRFWQTFQNSLIDDALFFDSLVSLKVGFRTEEVSSIECHEGLSRSSSSSDSLIVHCPKLQDIRIRDAHVCGLWSMFSSGQNIWRNVSKLHISARYYNMIKNNNNSEFGAGEKTCIMQFVDAVNKRIVCQLPNISDLEANSITNSDGLEYPFSSLIRAYSRQLKRLVCMPYSSFDICRFSDRLHTLNIGLGEAPILGLPVMDTDSLEILMLANISPAFSWNWFSTRASLEEIRFGRLTEFSIQMWHVDGNMAENAGLSLSSSSSSGGGGTIDKVDNIRLSVYMPRLHSFKVNLGNKCVENWNADIYMTNISQISLTGSFLSIAEICRHMVFKRVGTYDLHVSSMETADKDQFYFVTNHVFGDSNIYNHARLYLPSIPFDISVDDMNWIYLTHLSCAGIRFKTMTMLLPKLINLGSLRYDFVPDCLPDLTDNVVLSTSIHTIYTTSSLESGDYEYYSDEEAKKAFACAAYLITRIPSLCRADVYGNFVWELSDIIEEYAEEFPHLSRL